MRHVRTSSRLVLILALATLVLGGCGGGSSSSVPPTAAITSVYESFFGSTGSAAEVQGMTPQLQAAYVKSRSGSLGKGTSATVSKVVVQSSAACKSAGVPAPCAEVTYTIAVNGTPALPNATGYATKQGGKWLVAKATFCALEALEGSPPAGCS
jgi:hypothetical protein